MNCSTSELVLNSNDLTVDKALKIVGGLSKPGKMPGFGWSIPAAECKRGSKLREIVGSACHGCYACKGRYSFSNVKKALYRRLEFISNPLWIIAMSFLLKSQQYFRWFDSGDLQDVDMLNKIHAVCKQSSSCKHWLPTREFSIVKKYLKEGNKIPKNLTIRLSSDMVNEYPKHFIEGVPFSTISTDENVFADYKNPKPYNCPVSFVKELKSCEQAKCNKCWDKKVMHINYKKH